MTYPSDEDYNALFRSTFDPVWRFIRRRVQTTEDADDVTAEVFTVAWRRRADWPPANERKLWLFGVARNVLRTQARSTHRQQRLAGRLVAMNEVNPSVPEPATQDDSIWVALTELDDADRELLIMRAWDQLAVTEIAQLLNCTTNAVSVRLTRARSKLQIQLDRSGGNATKLPTAKSTKAGPLKAEPMKDQDRGGHDRDTRQREETK